LEGIERLDGAGPSGSYFKSVCWILKDTLRRPIDGHRSLEGNRAAVSRLRELEGSRRGQFLDAACADEEMRRELESLLAQRENAPSFIERRGLDIASELATRDEVKDLAGCTLGPYEIITQVGAGGMGIVYRARDTRLGREVAIKVLPERYVSDPDHLKYFEREARAASALNHPNIVTVHDVGQSEFGSYIAMEFVDGKTLREILAGGPLPAQQILHIAAQAAAGLARAHAAESG
jgi:serine/threonine protein kinase